MMNTDITYCIDPIGCPYKYACKRNLENYKTKETLEKGKADLIWVCNFEHSNTKCEYFY